MEGLTSSARRKVGDALVEGVRLADGLEDERQWGLSWSFVARNTQLSCQTEWNMIPTQLRLPFLAPSLGPHV